MVLPAVCGPVLSGSPRVGKAEGSGQEPPEAGYLETIPGGKKGGSRGGRQLKAESLNRNGERQNAEALSPLDRPTDRR